MRLQGEALAAIAVSTVGIFTAIVVLVGRLWTRTYFKELGLPTSGLEFTVYEYAFRSLEVLIGLLVGVVSFSAVFFWGKDFLGKQGSKLLLVEAVCAIAAGIFVLFFIENVLEERWIAAVGPLGLFSGLPLFFLAWLVADLWATADHLAEAGHAEEGSPVKQPRLRMAQAQKYVSHQLNTAHLTGKGAMERVSRKVKDFLGRRICPDIQAAREEETKRQETRKESRQTTSAGTGNPGIFELIKQRRFRELRTLTGALIKRQRPLELRMLAVAIVILTLSLYLPISSVRLARLKAESHVAVGQFPGAILEANAPLPEDIADRDNANRSRPVRVLLSNSLNTYVLHSTACSTIGSISSVVVREDGLLAPDADVCKVFTIPTARLNSIEYFQADKAPSNETYFRAEVAALGTEDEPAKLSFYLKGASDDKQGCRPSPVRNAGSESAVPSPTAMPESPEPTPTPMVFYNGVWFEFTPVQDGLVLAHVNPSGFHPRLRVWELSGEELRDAHGSGYLGIACEPAPDQPIDEDDEPQPVGVLVNVEAGKTYVVVVGAAKRGKGEGDLSLRLYPGVYYPPTSESASAGFCKTADLVVDDLASRSPTPTASQTPLPTRASTSSATPNVSGRTASSLSAAISVTPTPTATPTPTPTATPIPSELCVGPNVEVQKRDHYVLLVEALQLDLESGDLEPAELTDGSATAVKLISEDDTRVELTDFQNEVTLSAGRWWLTGSFSQFTGVLRLSIAEHPDIDLSLHGVDELLSDPCVIQALNVLLDGDMLAEQLPFVAVNANLPDGIGDCNRTIDSIAKAQEILQDTVASSSGDEEGEAGTFEDGSTIMVQFVGDTEKMQEAARLVKERLGDSAGGPVLTDSEADCGVRLCVRLSAGQMP